MAATNETVKAKELWILVDEIARSPSVTEAITHQSAGFIDQVTDSAVDAADNVDTAVRAVSMAVTRPVQKVSGLAAALSYGVSDFKVKHNWKHAVQAGKEAAARRWAHPISPACLGRDRHRQTGWQGSLGGQQLSSRNDRIKRACGYG